MSVTGHDSAALARSLIGGGWSPVPVRGKKPVPAGWQSLRLGLADVDAHFRNGENVGGILGKASGNRVDVDLDCSEALVLADRFLPATASVFGRPSNPASHRIYVSPDAPYIKLVDPVLKSDDSRSTLVELRQDGHQTVLPGSIHTSGEVIAWVRNETPATVPALDLAAAVYRIGGAALLVRYYPAMGKRNEFAMALSGALLRAGWDVPEAENFVGAVARAAHDEESSSRETQVEETRRKLDAGAKTTGFRTLAEMLDPRVAASVGKWLGLRDGVTRIGGTGWSEYDFTSFDAPVPAEPERLQDEDIYTPSDDDAHRALRNDLVRVEPMGGGAWPEPIPFDTFTVPAFPTSTLPPTLGTFVDATATATRTPPDLAGCLTLAAVSASVAGKYEVQVRDGWREPLQIFVVVVLPSGELKTPVFKAATEPIEEYERIETARMDPIVRDAETRCEVLSKRLKRAQDEAAKSKASEAAPLMNEALALARELAEAKPPARPRLIVDDATPERVSSLLAEQGGRLAVMSAEGGIFENLAGRYAANGAANFDVFLKAHAGEAIRVDRQGRPGEHVLRPSLTVGLAVQPDVIRDLRANPAFKGKGLLGRIFYSIPESRLGTRDADPATVSALVRAGYEGLSLRLLSIPIRTTPDGLLEPNVLSLSPAAREASTHFMRFLEPRLKPSGDLRNMSSWAGKLAGGIVRLAGLLHLAEAADRKQTEAAEIGAETLDRAMRLGKYFLAHAQAAFELMGSDPAVSDARLILEWVVSRDLESFSARDLYNAKRHDFPKADDVKPGLRVLEDRGHIRQREETARKAGRPPSPVYDVNPATRRGERD